MRNFLITTIFLLSISIIFPHLVKADIPPATPTPTPLPTIPAPTITDKSCDQIGKGSVYPPNSECYPKVDHAEKNIDKYPLSCLLAPDVTYKDTYTGFTPPGSVDITVTHDLSQITLGGYGPDIGTMDNAGSPDILSQLYLFNSLFDKPFYSLENTPREAWRTFWRLLSTFEQANVKSAYLAAIDSEHKNVSWHYLDSAGHDRETNDKQLRGSLPGCLKSVPVCKDFAKEYLKLNDTTRERYDTLQPFDFDNIRGYIVLGNQISKENLPYIQAILSGISGENGLFANLTPGWAVKDPEKLPVAIDELTLYSKILARAASVSCSPPDKATGLPAPKTYPTVSALSQTVTVPVTATLIDQEPSTCEGPNFYCEYFHTRSSCLNFGCNWHIGKKEYQLTGKATGKPLAVLNNPKVDQITDMVLGNTSEKIPGFFKMLTPDFAQIPDKSLIDAPTVSNSTNNPAATAINPATVWRENNLAQDSMEILQSCWAMPSSAQRSSLCGVSKATETGPFQCATDCAKTLPDASLAMSLKAKFTDLATRWLGVGTPQLQYYDTVVNSAVAAGVDPVFALTEWLNESDASNYDGICQKLGGGNPGAGYCQRVLDFGINLDAIASNPSTGEYHFQEQLSNFLGLPGYYKSACSAQMQTSMCPMRNFMAMFLVGQCEPTAASDGYYNHIKMLYEQWLAPGNKFPCYPSAYP